MDLAQQILFFFSALGVFNGLIICTYLLLFKRSKSTASYFLGLLLLMLSLRITKAIFSYFYPELPRTYFQIGLSSVFLIGPSLYYFTKAALTQVLTTPLVWKLTYWFWVFTIAIIGIAIPYERFPNAWNHYIVHLIYAQWLIYVALSGWILRTVLAKLFVSTAKLSPTEVSLSSIYIGNLLIFITYLLVFFGSSSSIYISGAVFFSLLLYLNIPLFMNRRKANTSFLGNDDLERYGKKKIPNEVALALTERLQRIILDQKLYKNPDLKLNELSKMINISGHQLSQLLNDNLGISFSVYINEYRINEACELIRTQKNIKLESIAYEVGFNSKSTFYSAFKKHTHTTPTIYKERISAISSN